MNHQIESDLDFDLQVEPMVSIHLLPIQIMMVDLTHSSIMVVIIEILNNRVKNPSCQLNQLETMIRSEYNLTKYIICNVKMNDYFRSRLVVYKSQKK